MDYRPQTNPYRAAAALDVGQSRAALLKKVYGLLTASVLFSAIGAMIALTAGVSSSQVIIGHVAVPPLVYLLMQNWWLGLILMLGSVFGASAVRQRPGINIVALFGMATIIGAVITPAIFIA